MQKLFRCALLICLVLIYKEGFSQRLEEINSLKHELPNAQNDSTRALITADISYWYLSINPDSSIYYGEQALSIAQKIKFYRGECLALAHLGNAVRFKGDIPGGMQLLMKALEISRAHGYTFESAYSIGRIGAIYLDNLKDYDKALTYFKLAHQVKVGNAERISRLFQIPLNMNTGMVYKHKGKMDSALFYMEKAYSLVNPSVSSFKPVVQMHMADLQFEMGNREVALSLLRQCLTFQNNENVDLRMSSEAANIMSNFFFIMNQPDSSIFYAKLALGKAKIIDHKQQILTAYNLLAELYEPRDLQKAYEYLKFSKAINNELYGAEKVRNFQKIIISDLERTRKIEEENIAYQNRVRLNFLLAGAGVFLLIFLMLFRNNRQKHKANKILQATLSDLKSTQSQLIQSEKMASLGELTAGIAHEIQNPLNFVNNFSEVNKELLAELKDEIKKGNLDEVAVLADDVINNEEKINHHGKRADAIVKGMLQHSRSSTGIKEPTDINALVDEYLRLAYHGLRAKDKSFNTTMKTEFDETIGNINIVPQDIGRVVLNLINNAFYAVSEKLKAESTRLPDGQGKYEPTVSISTKKEGSKVLISVKDNGNGIPQKILDKIFQPFYTTKPTGQGTGLGLSLSYDIVKAHGGEIQVITKETEGTVFIIQLPII